MNLFKTKMTAGDPSRVTTCEKKRVAWNTGIDQLDPVTRVRVNTALVALRPIVKGYVFNHSKKYQGKTELQWARELGVDHATISWHLNRWGHLDRCKKDYHKTRTQLHWGKTAKEWAEIIANPAVTAAHVREATRKGKEHFERYLSKKLGKTIKLKDAK